MTSPRRAEATAKGRYYRHPVHGEQLVSVTNVLSVAMAKPALIPWAAKIVGDKAADMLPRLVATSRARKDCRDDRPDARSGEDCGRCWGCTLREVKREVTVARDKAADLGSRVHALAEAHITGGQIAPQPGDDIARLFTRQYERFLSDFGVDLGRDVVAAEMTVANPAVGYAGTLDIILRLPAGEVGKDGLAAREPILIDLKTSLTRPAGSIYHEYSLQLAALRHATEAWMPDDTVVDMPETLGACILNLRTDTYALIPVDSGERELGAFLGALSVTQWVHSDPVRACRPVRPPTDPRPGSRSRKGRAS